MVEITIKDDGGVKGTESGDFVMAIISTIEEDGLKSVGMAYGVTSDKASAHAIAGFVIEVTPGCGPQAFMDPVGHYDHPVRRKFHEGRQFLALYRQRGCVPFR